MPKNTTGQNPSSGEAETILELLSVISTEESHTQRGLASRLGVALGLTNALVKRAARKGLIKIKNAPARRYAYYLTPEGFSEKSRLVSSYLHSSLDFFRLARGQYENVFDGCAKRGWKKIALVGSGELAEIALLVANSSGTALAGIIDSETNESHFCGIKVFRSLEEIGEVDALVLTDMRAPQQVFDSLSKSFPQDRIITPEILHISRSSPVDGGDAS